MEERYYIPRLEILSRVKYDESENSVFFTTHKKIDRETREQVQSIILREIDKKTNFFSRIPAVVIYGGIEQTLEREIGFHTLKDTIKSIISQKEELDQKIKKVIALSLKDYYFDKLGDALLRLRSCLRDNPEQFIIDQQIENIKILLGAYNENAGKNLSLEQILPEEVIPGNN